MWLILEGLLSAPVTSVKVSGALCLHLCKYYAAVSASRCCALTRYGITELRRYGSPCVFICVNMFELLFASLPLFYSCVLCLTDLEDFKTHRRSPVRVREGQGVVLLCGPPSHSGGKMAQGVVAFMGILQLESFPLRANILTPRSRRVSVGFAQKYWRRAITSFPYLLCIYRD